MITVGIIGGAGYTAGELIRLLLDHEYVKINFVFSTSNAGNKVYQVHQDLIGSTEMVFTDVFNPNVDLLFLCLGHGNSSLFLENNKLAPHTKIIDLSNDFRLEGDAEFQGREYVYGLPELNKEAIKKASAIANPGCFATAIQLALLPLAFAKKLEDDIHVNAVTGATGAGTTLSSTSHFTWRDNNFSHYKPFTHQHLEEIIQSLNRFQESFSKSIHFLPNRGNFSRGIFATLYTKYSGSLEGAITLYKKFYENQPFVIISEAPIHLKQVVNTNKCILHLHLHQGKLLITSVLDNLLKGASGQAVQNMNLMFGLPEDQGLKLKATYF